MQELHRKIPGRTVSLVVAAAPMAAGSTGSFCYVAVLSASAAVRLKGGECLPSLTCPIRNDLATKG